MLRQRDDSAAHFTYNALKTAEDLAGKVLGSRIARQILNTRDHAAIDELKNVLLQLEKGMGDVAMVVFSDDENGVKVDGLARLQNHRDCSLALLKQRENHAAK